MEWEETCIDTLEALARQDEAQAARWSLFTRCLRSDVLREYLDRLPAFEDGSAEQRAIEQALPHSSLDQGLSVLIHWPSGLGRASELVLKRRSQLDGDHYTLRGAAAEKLSQAHVLAATIALRSSGLSPWPMPAPAATAMPPTICRAASSSVTASPSGGRSPATTLTWLKSARTMPARAASGSGCRSWGCRNEADS